MTTGTELIQQIMTGDMAEATSETVARVKTDVSTALVELVDQGCRIRPLILAKKHIGFVRGVHTSERRLLFTWYPEPEDRIFHILSLGTTLTPAEIEDLDGYEAQTLMRVIDQCTDADTSLIPYVSAFASTSLSEVLWYGRGSAAASYLNRVVEIPGGVRFNLIAPPEHSRLWATMSAIRDRSKQNLDAAYNAAMITRALAGKGADRIFTSLKKTQKALASDAQAPWADVVKLDLVDVNFADGWGHAHQDDSIEGLLRENEGIEKIDRHEQAMNAIYQRQADAARAKAEKIEASLKRAMEFQGVDDSVVFLTDVEVKDIDKRNAAAQTARMGAGASAMVPGGLT